MDELGDLRTDEQIYVFTTMEDEDEGRDPVGLDLAPNSSLLAVPGRWFRCGTFC